MRSDAHATNRAHQATPSHLERPLHQEAGKNEEMMHYKNGREAKNGDKIIVIPNPKYGGSPRVGILYDATAGNNDCNGRLAPMSLNDSTPDLKDCLHIDDAMALLIPPPVSQDAT